MQNFTDFIVPLVIGGVFFWGMVKGVNVFDCFMEGAKDGLKVSVSILPALVCLLTAVSMFKASGALDVFTHALGPAAESIGIPREIIPLALLRPVSGSGAMVLFKDILQTYGPDSFVGRVASVLEGSTETTFYTIAVYYGATQVKKTRHTLVASLSGDVTGLIFSVLTVRLLLGG
ncbi:MAG: spore maturation protein [Angelakisella sp.]|nr:spore maturation protein [Angelakisella sp.]